MRALRLALAGLLDRPLRTATDGLLLALGVGVSVLVLMASDRLETRLTDDAGAVDLVVGPQGSGLTLVLSTLYHADAPLGNASLADLRAATTSPQVERAVPVGVGDSLAGFRLVGTQAAFLELYGAQIGEGRMFDQAMEVVAGASAARRLPLGASIAPTHGLSESGGVHEESPFTVVGHLKPTGTVVDRLALTPLASYWLTHGGAPGADAEHDHDHGEHDHSAHEHDHENADHGEHDHGEHSEHDHAEHDHDQAEHEHDHGVPQERRQATAMLVSVTSPIAVALLPDRIEAQHPELQAVSPARETTRLLALIDPAGDAVTILGGVVMGAAGLSVLAALAASVRQRRGEWAVLRLMGAGRGLILGQVSFEGLLVGLIGGLGGLILAEVAAFTLSLASAEARALGLGLAVPSPAQWGAAAAALGVGALAGLIPALIALARDPERDVMEA